MDKTSIKKLKDLSILLASKQTSREVIAYLDKYESGWVFLKALLKVLARKPLDIEQIISRIPKSRNSCRIALKSLESVGLVEIEGGGNKKNVYLISEDKNLREQQRKTPLITRTINLSMSQDDWDFIKSQPNQSAFVRSLVKACRNKKQ